MPLVYDYFQQEKLNLSILIPSVVLHCLKNDNFRIKILLIHYANLKFDNKKFILQYKLSIRHLMLGLVTISDTVN